MVRAHLIKREQKLALRYHLGARLVFADGTPDILAYPRDRPAWGRLCRLLTVGNLRAEKGECILYLDDLLELIDGLELIVMERSTWELPSLPFLRGWSGAGSQGRPKAPRQSAPGTRSQVVAARKPSPLAPSQGGAAAGTARGNDALSRRRHAPARPARRARRARRACR